MRSVVLLALLGGLLAVALSTRADNVPRQKQQDGKVIDERQRLAEKILEASQSLSRIQMEPDERRDLQFKLRTLVYRLRQTSVPPDQVGEGDIRDVQRKLTLKESEARERLARGQSHRQRYAERAARFRKMRDFHKGQEVERTLEKMMQSNERAARECEEREAEVAKEVAEWERLSRLVADLAKKLPPSPKEARPAKK